MYTLLGIRKSSPYTIDDIIQHMDISMRTLYAWERGDYAISAYNLVKLLRFYDMDHISMAELDLKTPAAVRDKQIN